MKTKFLGNRQVEKIERSDGQVAVNPEFESLIRQQLELIGEDPEREGLRDTPRRVSRSLRWLTQGYRTCVEDVVGKGVFKSEGHRNMIMVRDIELYSLCEHHMLPFFGKAHVAYIPNGHIVGLSKSPRIVDVFARRLQVQERLTQEIAQTLFDELQPLGVMVVIEAEHTCMTLRGVRKADAKTITSAVLGGFRTDPRTRAEAMALITGKD